jgi:hypothetical protein
MNPDRNVKGFLFLGAPSSPSEISMSSPISTQAAMIEEQSTIFSGALWQKSMIERVQFFMQGSHDKLVQSMNKSEAR